MAFDEKKHQEIEDYLNNKLKGDGRKKFEQQMQADEQLSKEVEMHRDMDELLSDSPENALRKSLKLLGEQAETTPAKKSRRWIFTVFIPVLLIIIWWVWSGIENTPDDVVTPVIEEITPLTPEKDLPSAPAEDAPIEPEDKEEKTEQQPASKPASPPPNPGRKRGQREPAPRAIAANFVPNPSIEFLIENNLRDAALTVKLIQKQPDVQLAADNDPTSFQIKIQLQSREDISQQAFKLHLFSNDRQAFDDFSPLATSDLDIVAIETDIYQIDFTKSYALAPGLYYYIVEDFSSEKIHLVQKFEVK